LVSLSLTPEGAPLLPSNLRKNTAACIYIHVYLNRPQYFLKFNYLGYIPWLYFILKLVAGYQLYATIGAFYLPLAVMLVIYTRIYMVSERLSRSECRSRPISLIGRQRGGSTVSSSSKESHCLEPKTLLINGTSGNNGCHNNTAPQGDKGGEKGGNRVNGDTTPADASTSVFSVGKNNSRRSGQGKRTR